tara:strand:- start:630 stop:830 length:201 start_codon:yes stop_codon:yes gene_type:complete
MKYAYRVKWANRSGVIHDAFIEAHSVLEAIQIAGYEHGVGTAYNVPILEVKIIKELEDDADTHNSK